jgi:hypothetical protein
MHEHFDHLWFPKSRRLFNAEFPSRDQWLSRADLLKMWNAGGLRSRDPDLFQNDFLIVPQIFASSIILLE